MRDQRLVIFEINEIEEALVFSLGSLGKEEDLRLTLVKKDLIEELRYIQGKKRRDFDG